MKMSVKLRAQVKSRWYYIFWGIATVSVVSGQVYVGNGYRMMTEQMVKTTDATNKIFEVLNLNLK